MPFLTKLNIRANVQTKVNKFHLFNMYIFHFILFRSKNIMLLEILRRCKKFFLFDSTVNWLFFVTVFFLSVGYFVPMAVLSYDMLSRIFFSVGYFVFWIFCLLDNFSTDFWLWILMGSKFCSTCIK